MVLPQDQQPAPRRDWVVHLTPLIPVIIAIAGAVWAFDGRLADLKGEIANARQQIGETKTELKGEIAKVNSTGAVAAEQISGLRRDLDRIDVAHTSAEQAIDRKLDGTLLQINGMAVNVEALKNDLKRPSR